jgi:hypothetical protein
MKNKIYLDAEKESAIFTIDDREYEVSIETLTPEVAIQYLATSEGNRKINPDNIKKIKLAMESNTFHGLNGETIIFDEGNHLADGHTRCTAASQVPGFESKVFVIKGILPEDKLKIDKGVSRTPANDFQLAGIKSASLAAAIIIGYFSKIDESSFFSKCYRTREELIEEYRSNEKLYTEVIDHVNQVCENQRNLSPKLIGSSMVYLIKEKKYPKERVYNFFSQVGLLCADERRCSIVKWMNKTLNDHKEDSSKTNSFLFKSVLLTKTFNCWASGRGTNKLISYSVEKDKDIDFLDYETAEKSRIKIEGV